MRARLCLLCGLLMGTFARAQDLQGEISAAATRHGLSEQLVRAVAQVESGLNAGAVSHKGALGLMQLMPKTAARFGVADPFDVRQSLDGGCAYLRWLLEHFAGRVELALAGYNAGEQAVERYGGIPPYGETREYVRRVLAELVLPMRSFERLRTAKLDATGSAVVELSEWDPQSGTAIEVLP